MERKTKKDKESPEELKKLEEKLKSLDWKPIESPIKKISKWKFLKDKDGNKLSAGEYLKKWGEGIKNLTPLQRILNESRATLITLIGSIVALVSLIIFRDRMLVSWFAYGLILIFLGNSWSQGLKWLGLRQQIKLMKNLEGSSTNIKDILDKLDKFEEVKDE